MAELHGRTMFKAQLKAHLEAALVFSGVMVALAGALGAGLSLLLGTGGMLAALRSAPLLAVLGPIAGLLLMPIFFLAAAAVAALPALMAGLLFFVAAASSVLNRVPAPLVPLLCAAFAIAGVHLAGVVLGNPGFNLRATVFGSLSGLVSGAVLFWLPALRALTDHLRGPQESN